MMIPKIRLLPLSVLLLAGIVAGAAHAAGQTSENAAGRQPAAIITCDSDYVLLVEKATQRLSLLAKADDGYAVEKTYACSTGQKQGDKQLRGDLKTPEGVYYFVKKYLEHQLESRYGSMAFVLDYPNALDQREGKSGNGIWLHGLDRPLLPNDSKGCIALVNRDIEELSSKLQLWKTPIIVEERVQYRTMPETVRLRNAVEAFVAAWETAWEHKDLDAYTSCYDPRKFKPQGWQRWVNHKQGLNERYKFIDVQLSDLNVFEHDGTFVARFTQDYESDQFTSSGRKTLFLQHNSSDLKIIGEDWQRSGRTPGKAVASDARLVARLLNRWVTAWEQQNISQYIDCYSRSFQSQNMSWDEWKQYKTDINAKNSFIQVIVNKPEIHLDGAKAKVRYVQKYISDSYTDYGLKNVTLVNENGGWKIVSEDWEPL